MIVQTYQQEIAPAQQQQAHWPKQGIYCHYKGNLYRVIAVCRHTPNSRRIGVLSITLW